MNQWLGTGKILHSVKATNKKTAPILRLSVVTADMGDDGKEDRQFHNVVAKGQGALHWEKVLSKGDLIEVVCALQYYRSSRGGPERRISELVVEKLRLLSRGSEAFEREEVPF